MGGITGYGPCATHTALPTMHGKVDAAPVMPVVLTSKGVGARKIKGHDLSLFKEPVIPGNRNNLWRAAWYLVNAWLFQSAVLALIPSSLKARILRLFGAKVGAGFVCKPRVTIKYPWFFEIGNDVWLGEMVWIDNHTTVKLGNSVCVSQGAYLFTGNHDWNDPTFPFFCKPIEIGDGCWLGTGVRVVGGTCIGPGAVTLCEGRPSSAEARVKPIMAVQAEPKATYSLVSG